MKEQTFQPSTQNEIQEIKKLAEQLKPFLPIDSQMVLDECVAQYERKEVVVMVAGEVSVGKSSLLNVLLGRPILLTDLTETTAAITYLRSADGDREAKPNMAKVTYNDDHVEWLPLEKTALTKVTTSLENDDALHKVRKVDVFVSGIIPPGITIVDTPGLNGGAKHSELTHREMGLCHAALFLLDASKAGTLSESRELQKMYDYAPKVFFVLSKWDDVRKARPGYTLNDIKKEYLHSIGRITHSAQNGMEVSARDIYVVSAKEGLDALKKSRELRRKHPKAKQPDIRQFLPNQGVDNEIFDLFADLMQSLDKNEITQMLRLRPLLTMKNLAEDALKELDERLHLVEDTKDIDANITRLELELEKSKQAIQQRNDRIGEKIVSLAQEEQKEMLALIDSAAPRVVAQMKTNIENSQAYQRKDSETLANSTYLQHCLNRILQNEVITPLSNKVNDFMTLVNYSFETSENLSVNLPQNTLSSVPSPTIAAVTSSSSMKFSDLQDTEKKLQNEITSLELELELLEKDCQKCQYAHDKVKEMDQQIASVDNDLREMGSRPGAD